MMTYRYCQLAVGRKFPTNRPIRWEYIEIVVPCDENGIEIPVATKEDDLKLWNKQVINYKIDGKIFYANLKGV